MNNTVFSNYIAQDLGRFALKGLITKTAIDPAAVDYICMGTVIQEGEFSASFCILLLLSINSRWACLVLVSIIQFARQTSPANPRSARGSPTLYLLTQ
jgi:hypothetical protein